MAKATIRLRIDTLTLEQIHEIAKRRDRSRSWIINDFLRLCIKADEEVMQELSTHAPGGMAGASESIAQ